ncbi:MAG: enoyl-CoA hydratase family protein [Planctomycetes bacterium]|nr:enoyl-CoA hydratase family protein [Planctomycetota bacterium]
MNPKTFRYSEADGVGTLTLDRPDRLNSLTFEIYRELAAFIPTLEERASTRVLMLTGEGKGFCSGGDVEDIIGRLFERDAAGLLEFTRVTGAVVRELRALRKPVIAAVNGTCCGAGALLAIASDLRLLSASAKVAFLFVKVGLSGADMGACQILPRIVGLGRASEILMRGEFLSSEECLRIGLANRVYPDAEFRARAAEYAYELACGPAFGLSMTKEMLEREYTMDTSTAVEAEAQAQAICMGHPDFREAYEAWKAKRPIRFQGAPGHFGVKRG